VEENVGFVMRLLVAIQTTMDRPEVGADVASLCKTYIGVVEAHVRRSMESIRGLENVAAVVAALSHAMAISTQDVVGSDDSFENIRVMVKTLLEKLCRGPVSPYRKDVYGE